MSWDFISGDYDLTVRMSGNHIPTSEYLTEKDRGPVVISTVSYLLISFLSIISGLFSFYSLDRRDGRVRCRGPSWVPSGNLSSRESLRRVPVIGYHWCLYPVRCLTSSSIMSRPRTVKQFRSRLEEVNPLGTKYLVLYLFYLTIKVTSNIIVLT